MPRFLLVLLLALTTAAPAFAGEGKSGRLAEIADALELDDAHRAAVEDIVYKSEVAKVDAKARLKKSEIELKRALAAETLDEKAIRTATDGVASATAELIRIRVDRIVAIRRQLTAAQWSELKQIWKSERDDDEDEDEDEEDDD